ncbi:MAG: hypothetical protein RL032_2005 [Pseudomonadota bacterium]|jgi:hypothetical protein
MVLGRHSPDWTVYVGMTKYSPPKVYAFKIAYVVIVGGVSHLVHSPIGAGVCHLANRRRRRKSEKLIG